MVRQEWKKLLHNKILLVVILAVIAIPSIYTTLFLGSMWDPYGNTDKLPVAVVNEDQPVEYQGAVLDIGGELVKKLKEEKSLDFHFVEKKEGEQGLKDGTYYMMIRIPEDLVENGPSLLLGASQLSQGGEQIGQGAGKLYEGSQELGEGLKSLEQGAGTLKNALEEGGISAGNSILSEEGMDMFADPAVTKETQITEVENNGHAMAPYMMSVGLWVGCIAFSLMYPLTEYSGKLKSGGAWWRSKASVLYLVALLQAAVMTGALRIFDGFRPVQPGKTLLTACLASLDFMSIMYFFTNLLGKAGSFLMLVFMVVQLAGSVGTYPLELSGTFVPYLHDWVPFTYTVTAFRSTISGGESIGKCLQFLGALFLVFSLMTVLEFQIRAGKIKRGKRTWVTWLKAHGLE